ncbi:MAG: insulinase family protein [SAR324 cluster bacterium]|nr:insulinase family protein [SAR324 cluster bacterium]
MRVLYRHAPAFPLTQVVVIFPRTGVCLDPQERQGLTRMTLRMLFAGAGGLSNAEFHARLERLGASIGHSLATDFFTLRLVTLTANLDAALKLFLLAANQPNLESAEFARLKEELHSSWITEREESKNLRAQEVYINRIYRGLPNGYQLDGTGDGIRRITVDDVRSHYRSLFQRGEPIVGMLTDLLRDEAEDRISGALAHLTTATDGLSHPWDDFRAERPKGRHVTIVPDLETQTDELIGGVFSTGENGPDWHIHRLISLIFGGDMNSRLFRVIRGERGYSYGAACWYETSQGRCPRDQISPFTMYTFPTVEHTRDALPMLLSLYEEFVENGVDDDELHRAKEALINSHAFLRDSPQKLLALDCDEALYGFGFDDEEANQRKIASVQPADLQRVLRETHHPECLTLVMLGDPRRLEPIAAKISGVEQLDTVEYPPPTRSS